MQAVVDLCRDGIVAQCQNIIFDSTVPGGISLLETKSANLNRVTIHGYDLEVAYRRPMLFGIGGNLSLRTLINYAPENKTFDPLTGITTERAGSLTAPKLAATVTLGWNNERVNANVQFRGFGERRGNALLFNSPNTVLGPEDAGYNVANGNTVNRNRYAGRIYVNPSVDVKINDAISAFANVDNLFDAGPPPLTANNLYDLIGRRFRVGVRARL
jgi:outer membrane receptor protein involved in Fe transport